MRKVLLLQALVTLVASALFWLFSGRDAAISALLSGLACWAPNVLFALNLRLFSSEAAGTGVAVFFVGEIIKLAAAGLLLYLAAVLFGNFSWVPALVTMALVLNSSFLGLLIRE